MSLRRVLRSVVAMVAFGGASAIVTGCMIAWLIPIGLEARIVGAEEQPLADTEIAELRELTKEVSENYGLHGHLRAGPDAGYLAVYDSYKFSPTPGGKLIVLSVSQDHKHAYISVTDDVSESSENDEGTKELMDRVLEGLAKRLPDRKVEVETVHMSFWQP